MTEGSQSDRELQVELVALRSENEALKKAQVSGPFKYESNR